VAVDPGAALVLLDFEGADGVEAGDSRIVETTFNLFAIVLCPILIINIDEKQISSINGSGKALLRAIMESYLGISGGNPECVHIYQLKAVRLSLTTVNARQRA
jgi:hypothetical protein